MELLLLRSVYLKLSKQMHYPEERYYKWNQFLLSVSGLCPHQNKLSAYLRRIAFTIIMLSALFVQFTSLFTSDITIDYIVDWVPPYVIVACGMIMFYIFITHVDKFEELFKQMSNNWALKKTHNEIKIMHEHAETSRLYTLLFPIVGYVIAGTYGIWILMPEILDIISPMNESRPRNLFLRVEYFVDEQRYFCLIWLHVFLVVFTVFIIYFASSTLFVTLAQHTCGMCQLLGYRAERLFYVDEDKATDLIPMTQINYGSIATFVRLHYNIIKFVDIIETCYTILFLLEVVGGIIMTSFTLIQILTISNVDQAVRSISVTTVALYYIFVSSYMGQKITDIYSNVYEKMFNSAWYNAVASEQKTLLIIMMRCYHPFILTACKFYAISLRNFGMVLQTTISYCMFIRQL